MHTMTLMRKHEGIEEWLCSTCGRHMLVNWYPKFKRTILQEGDSTSGHSGFKGESQIQDMMNGALDETSNLDDQHIPVDEARLSPWSNWMDKSDFADLWNGSTQ